MTSLLKPILLFKLGKIQVISDALNMLLLLFLVILGVIFNNRIVVISVLLGFYLALFVAHLGVVLVANRMKVEVTSLKLETTGWRTITKPVVLPYKQRNAMLVTLLVTLYGIVIFIWLIYELINVRVLPSRNDFVLALSFLKIILLGFALYFTIPSFVSPGGEIVINLLFQRLRDTRLIPGIMLVVSLVSVAIMALIYFLIWKPDFSIGIGFSILLVGLVSIMFYVPQLRHPIRLLQRAYFFLKQNNYPRAIEDCTTILDLKLGKQPNTVISATYHLRGLAYLGLSQLDLALADFKQSTAINPNSAAPQLDWLWVELSEETRPTQEQLTWLRNLSNLAGSYAAKLARIIFDWLTMEHATFSIGDLIARLQTLIDESPEATDAYYWQGVIYQANNQPAEAEEMYAKAVEEGLPPPLNKRFQWL